MNEKKEVKYQVVTQNFYFFQIQIYFVHIKSRPIWLSAQKITQKYPGKKINTQTHFRMVIKQLISP